MAHIKEKIQYTHTQNIFDYVGQHRESTVDMKATSTKQHI